MGAQGPLSLDLVRYLAHEREAYDAFVFVSYLYATTYFGLPLVADRALLLPLAHDEWMLRLPMWDRIFALPRGFVYNTAEERDLIARRFPKRATGGPVIGVGIDPPPATDPERFRRTWGIERPFALSLGRVDASKGTDELLRAHRRSSHTRELVLMGERQMRVPATRDVTLTGPVDEQMKWDALAACDVLVLPSRYESLSLAALEAWATGKPVLANARAHAVAGQIARSGGGLTYDGEADLARRLDEAEPGGGAEAGRRGAAFVDEHYAWPVIEARFTAHLVNVMGWSDDASTGSA
jgi:glycosyltransferase involved in cell wall biosynthesis